VIKNKPTNAAIYCRATAKRGHFEPEDADILAYQTGSAMAFIRDHNLTFVRLYEDDLSSEGVSDDTRDRILKDSAAELIDVIISISNSRLLIDRGVTTDLRHGCNEIAA